MYTFDRDCFLDFETRSRAKLVGKDSVGSWRYAEDESTTVICLGWAINNSEPRLWTPGLPIPYDLQKAIEEGWKIHGWNSMSFERAIFEHQMKYQHGWVTPQPEQYHDSMLDALTLALPASLENCGEAMGLQVKKDKEGKRLIQFLCKPIASGKKKGEFRERSEFPREYAAMYVYCKQDVRSEREIFVNLPYHLQGKERELALLIMKINERGLPVNRTEIEAIATGIEREKLVLKEHFRMLSGIASPTQRAKYQAWLNSELPIPIDDTQAETIRDILLRDDIDWNLRKVMELGQEITKTSNAKYKKLLSMICKDGTVKNNLIFNKANTGRLAGAGFQCQNLPAACERIKDVDALIDSFVDEDYFFLREWRGVLPTASGLVRAMIKAPAGMKFINGDLKGVEARGAMWVCQEWEELKLIKLGHDVYIITAANMYKIPVSELTKKSPERAAGKIAVLAGGFGGGKNALLKMALKMGMDMDLQTAAKHIRDFRGGRPKLPKTWYAFAETAKKAMDDPGLVFPVDNTKRYGFVRLGDYLYMVLPNKRLLSFPYPRMEIQDFFGRPTENLTAMWMSNYTHKWERRTLTGANLFQSAVQATCRDLLMEAHLRIEKDGMPIMLSVHDESQSLVPDDPRYTKERYEQLMNVVPEWAKDFPIASDCWEGYRFRK